MKINLSDLELLCRGTLEGKMVVCLTCADCLALIRVARSALNYVHNESGDIGYGKLEEALKEIEGC